MTLNNVCDLDYNEGKLSWQVLISGSSFLSFSSVTKLRGEGTDGQNILGPATIPGNRSHSIYKADKGDSVNLTMKDHL